MGSLDLSMKPAPRLASIASRNLDIHCRAKRMVESLLSRLLPIGGASEADESPGETVAGSRPSASLVPLPVTSVVSGRGKNPCPVLSYREFLGRRGGLPGGRTDAGSAVCAVCMNCLEGSDQVRELCYCAHAFHLECLDAWVDRGHGTCPICRSKLWSDPREEPREDGGDPWRVARMIYLFGEDLEF